MSEIKHTPEPWHVVAIDAGLKAFYIQADKARIAKILVAPTEEIDEANARRIVACVNALAHVSTEQLESGQMLHLGQSLADVTRQRDELLAVTSDLMDELAELRLVGIMGNANANNLPAFVKRFVAAHEKAKAAIAKVEANHG